MKTRLNNKSFKVVWTLSMLAVGCAETEQRNTNDGYNYTLNQGQNCHPAYLQWGCWPNTTPSGGLSPLPTGGGTTTPPNSPTPTPTPTPTPGGPGSNWTTGGSTNLIVNQSALEAYTGRRLNNPNNIKLNVDLSQSISGVYSGSLKIAYNEQSSSNSPIWYEAEFTSGTSDESRFNKFYTEGGTQFFKGFFEDADFNYSQWIGGVEYGGLILIVDNTPRSDLKLLSGKVYFKNYNRDVCNTLDPWMCNPMKPARCWFIQIGPYACRDFLSGDQIRPDLVSAPVNYQLLGTFTDLRQRDAFH